MKFGKVDYPENIDFSLPEISSVVLENLSEEKKHTSFDLRFGGTSWNKSNFNDFYPKGIKNELEFYSHRFNAIEFNASFYRNFSKDQYNKWKHDSADGFKFFPKVMQEISHWKRLRNVEESVKSFLDSVVFLGDKLGTIFLQLPNNFSSKHSQHVFNLVSDWPKGISLGIERRHADWFEDRGFIKEYNEILRTKEITNIVVDTAGRRDVLHLDLTNDELFVRFVACNIDEIDIPRINAWVKRIQELEQSGLSKCSFFIHQDYKRTTLLANHFVKEINRMLDLNINLPKNSGPIQGLLF